MSDPYTAPLFTAQQQSGGPPNPDPNDPTYMNDLFSDCFFTPDGSTVFLSENSDDVKLVAGTETTVAPMASRIINDQAVPVNPAGGIATTGLDQGPGVKSTVMGPGGEKRGAEVPFAMPPQKEHHLGFAVIDAPSASQGEGRRKERKMSDQQKSERRERNREHAKRSRIRKKFLLESLQKSVQLLKDENRKLKDSISKHLGPDVTNTLLSQSINNTAEQDLITSTTQNANKVLDDPDFNFVKALQTAQQNFVVTDPSLPDNPIVYATQGFLNLTGYSLDQVLGRNCRFLQGPETDPRAVEKIRKAIEAGTDMSVCLLNYRVDGTTFWNQFFIAALRDTNGNITNYVGVQCKVSDTYAATVCKRQEEHEGEQEGVEDEEDGS